MSAVGRGGGLRVGGEGRCVGSWLVECMRLGLWDTLFCFVLSLVRWAVGHQ